MRLPIRPRVGPFSCALVGASLFLPVSEPNPDIVIIGAGAAGLMTAICAARGARSQGIDAKIIVLDGARKIGAKILVAGGGRCNVTHHRVLPSDYAGSSRNAIKKVLRAFPKRETIAFFADLGVGLKQEATGKMFPVTDSAQTVLSALLDECARLGVRIKNPWRVKSVKRRSDGFEITPSDERNDPLHAGLLVLATGGMALPRTGSDGAGYAFARSLGHRVTERVFPALVPLVVADAETWIRELSGISTRATIEVRSGTGKRLASFTNEILCTHFGLSGPGVLDVSRWYLDAKMDDAGSVLVINWLGEDGFESSMPSYKRSASNRSRASCVSVSPSVSHGPSASGPASIPRLPGTRSRASSDGRWCGRRSSAPWRSSGTGGSLSRRSPPAGCRSMRSRRRRWAAACATTCGWWVRSWMPTDGSAASTSSGPGRAGLSPAARSPERWPSARLRPAEGTWP